MSLFTLGKKARIFYSVANSLIRKNSVRICKFCFILLYKPVAVITYWAQPPPGDRTYSVWSENQDGVLRVQPLTLAPFLRPY